MKKRIKANHDKQGGLRWAALALLILTVLLHTPGAQAQVTCVGPAIGVPANGTPPDWWVTPASAVYAHDIDDPRWVGAGSISMGDGVSNIVDFRALQDASFLYLSWRVQHVTLDTHDDTLLYFGFPQPAGDPLIVKVNLKLNDAHSDETGSVAALSAVTRNSAGGSIGQGTPVGNPVWVADTLRVWSQQIGPTKPLLNSWAVHVRVPRSAVQFTAGKFKLWFDVKNATPATPTIDMPWPASDVITQDLAFNDIFPDPATWGSFQPSTGPGDPACATAGVSLAWDQIGTLNPDPHQINLLSANTFVARPTNNSGAPISANQINARFRIANWGSDPMGWEAGVNDSTLWADIPGGSTVSNAGAIADSTAAHGDPTRNDNEFAWTLSPAEQGQFVGHGGTRLLHQCILVELSSPASVKFVNNSVRRNMDFVNASTFTREAEISIKGMTPIAPDGRDVYVWVETLNMPNVVKSDAPPPMLRTLVPTPTPTPIPTGESVLKARSGIPQEGQPIPLPGGGELQQLLAAGRVTPEMIEEVAPTYIVHVYHDTGKTQRLGGVDRPVLVAQGAFGYIVSHQGQLYGWQHQLVGQGFALEQIAPDFYRIRKVPNDGVVRVVTTITALEQAPTTPIQWWWWLILLILILLILWLILRKKNP